MASLAQLRESLVSLNSYHLPERYKNDPEKMSSNADRPVLDDQAFSRYRTARDTYLKSRVTELFLEHLSTYDGIHNNITLPPLPSQEDEEEIRTVEEKVKADLSDAVLKLRASFRSVYDNYSMLHQRREELTRVIEDMGKSLGSDVEMMTKHGEEDVEMDENDVLLMEEKLQRLIKQRGDLESTLRDVRMEKQELSFQVQQRKEMMREFLTARGADPSTEKLASGFSLDSSITLETMEKEIELVRKQSIHYRDMADFYNSERNALEEIGGMKILSVTPFETGVPAVPNVSVSSSSQSVAMRRRSSSSASKQYPLPSNNNPKDGIILKVLLLNQHLVKVTLDHHDAPNSDGNNEILRVSNAQFETSTILTIPSGRVESDSARNLSLSIPPLDDLVRLASQMEPGYDLRFLLRETMARIRSLTARVEELSILRTKYLTKFANIANNYGFGGEDQEVVCSLNAGITVVLRMTADCPILDGSCYIHQLVGVGGWDEGVLQRMKTRVNGMKNRRGPVEVMDSLVEELSRLERDEGLIIPKTPPSLKKNGE